jgi:hypothetical protein
MHPTVVTRMIGAATFVAIATAVILRVLGHERWHDAFAVVLALLGVRIAVIAWRAARHELPWLRLVLPAIILVEGIGLYGSSSAWQVRLATAVLLELTFVVVAIRELWRIAPGDDPLEVRIARAFDALLPARFARLVAFELVIVGAALRFLAGGWRRPIPRGFTYHRASGLRFLLPLLPLLAVGDVLLLELVILAHAPMWLRVGLHVLGNYGLIWLVGLYATVRARPHQLRGDRVLLNRGILGRVTLDVGEIVSIDPLPSFADDWKKRAYCKGAIRIDIAGPPILELQLRSAVRPIGILGEGPPRTRVLVAVDEPAEFMAAMKGTSGG